MGHPARGAWTPRVLGCFPVLSLTAYRGARGRELPLVFRRAWRAVLTYQNFHYIGKYAILFDWWINNLRDLEKIVLEVSRRIYFIRFRQRFFHNSAHEESGERKGAKIRKAVTRSSRAKS